MTIDGTVYLFIFWIAAAAGTPGVSGVAPRTVAADDGGQTTGGQQRRRFVRSRSPQGPQVAFRTPQSARRKGLFV